MNKFNFKDQMILEMRVRNYSHRTIESYVTALSKLTIFHQLAVEQLTVDQLKEYLNHRIIHDHISVSMVNQTISAYKIYHVDVLKKDPLDIRIKRPRRERKLPAILSTKEIEKMITVTLNLKHRAIIALAYSAGLRKEELKYLKPENIDSARMRVHIVRGKGNKSRYSILSEKVLLLLRMYYNAIKPREYLFESNQHKGKPLANSTLNMIVKIAAKKAGIKKQVYFHTLRHCFATHMLEKGVNLKAIQHLMGHQSMKTTSVYLSTANMNAESLRSPLDEMNI